MRYVKQSWANGAVGATPLSAARLAYMEAGIEAAGTLLPNGVDDTAAIDAAGVTGQVILGRGTFIYTGTGITNLLFNARGAGKESTYVNLGANSYFYHRTSGLIQELSISGITFVGGKGAIRQSFTGPDSYYHRHISDCHFLNYTECAIADLGEDTPYWKIDRCFFDSANYTSTIGVAIAGQPDAVEFNGCSFTKNRVGIKLTGSGLSATIRNCDFFRTGASSGSPRVDVWLVPSALTLGAGGMVISDSKFGPEFLEAADYHVVVADEAAGTDFSTKMPALTTASSGKFCTVTVKDCELYGVSGGTTGPPLLYTTTPSLYGFNIGPINLGGAVPRNIVESITPLPVPDVQAGGNTLGPVYPSTSYQAPISPSNCPGLFKLLDPAGVFASYSGVFMDQTGGGGTTGYKSLITAALSTYTDAGTSSVAATDAKGGTNAIEVTVAGAGTVKYTNSPIGTAIDNYPVVIEFDLKVGATSPLSLVEFAFGANPNYQIKRLLTPPALWTRYRYVITAQELAAGAIWIIFGAPVAAAFTGTKFQVGRVRVYHAREPVLTDLDLPVATTTTTAPGAGGGSALPATPAGYITVYVNGTARQIAYY